MSLYNSHSPPAVEALRRDAANEIYQAANLSVRVRAIVASAAECNGKHQTGRVANLADDLKVLGRELTAAGERLFDLNCEIGEQEAQADHGATVEHLNAYIAARCEKVVEFPLRRRTEHDGPREPQPPAAA